MPMTLQDCKRALVLGKALKHVEKLREAFRTDAASQTLTLLLVAFSGNEDGGDHIRELELPSDYLEWALGPIEQKLKLDLDKLDIAV